MRSAPPFFAKHPWPLLITDDNPPGPFGAHRNWTCSALGTPTEPQCAGSSVRRIGSPPGDGWAARRDSDGPAGHHDRPGVVLYEAGVYAVLDRDSESRRVLTRTLGEYLGWGDPCFPISLSAGQMLTLY